MKLDLSCQPLDVVKEFLLSSFRRGCLESPQAIAFFNIYPAQQQESWRLFRDNKTVVAL